MTTTRFFLAGALLLGGTACSDTASPDTAGSPDAAASLSAGVGTKDVVLLTQNLYVGADVDAVLLALGTPDPDDDVAALMAAIETLQRTDFPARAAALARKIRNTRPHAVGLQEVSVIEIVLPPLGLDLRIEFLPILLQALADEGLSYQVAAQVQNIDASPTAGVRQVDFDVLLVDAERVTVHSASGQNFSDNVGPLAPGVSLIRGWVQADVTIAKRRLTLVSAHPEPNLGDVSFADLRALQMAEIADSLDGVPSAVIMGDLNDIPGSPMYQILRQAGFTDTWAALRPGQIGFTCCHAPDLSNDQIQFDERIDYIFAKGFARGRHEVLGEARRLGIDPANRPVGQAGEIWISDHAGLLATLRLPPR